MRKTILGIVLTQMLICSVASAGHVEVDPYALESCINGGVSASGLFASQEEESTYFAKLAAEDLEPCINGGVSANGLFASQAEQDALLGSMAAN